jgi:hypothetical protein
MGQVRPVSRIAQRASGPCGRPTPGDMLEHRGSRRRRRSRAAGRLELPRELRLELDLAIAPVRVVEPGPQAAAVVGSVGQRIDARSTATMIARNAIPYWSASIERSIRPGSSLLGTTVGPCGNWLLKHRSVDSCRRGFG